MQGFGTTEFPGVLGAFSQAFLTHFRARRRLDGWADEIQGACDQLHQGQCSLGKLLTQPSLSLPLDVGAEAISRDLRAGRAADAISLRRDVRGQPAHEEGDDLVAGGSGRLAIGVD